MGSKQKKGLRESIDDVLDDLLGDDDKSPRKSAFPTTQSGSAPRRSATTLSRTNKEYGSLLDDDFFNKLAQEAGKDNDESEISEVDHQALLETMKDINDMDADLFGTKKNLRSVPNQPVGNPAVTVGSKPEFSTTAQRPAAAKDLSDQDEKPHCAATTSRHHYKKFTFTDADDPLAGILSDEEEEPKNRAVSGQKPGLSNTDLQAHKKEEKEKEDCLDDFAFGSYQPTVATSPEDRQSRRQSVRFSPEGNIKSTVDQKPKTARSTSVTPTQAHGSKGAADWLGLKDDDVPDLDNQKSTEEMQKGSMFYKAKSDSNLPASHNQSKRPYSAGRPPSAPKPSETALVRSAPSSTKADAADVVEGDWLKEILSQKKSPALGSHPLTLGDGVDGLEDTCKQSGLSGARGQSSITASPELAAESNLVDSGSSFPREISQRQAIPPVLSDTLKDSITKNRNEPGPAQAQKQDMLSTLQRLQSKSERQGPTVDVLNAVQLENTLTTVQNKLRSTKAEQQATLQAAEIKIIELESKVRKLELEREQQKILLESLQQQHKDDLELIEDTHRNRLKVIELSYQQRMTRLQDENLELAEQHVARQQCLDRERSELVARYQRKLTEFEEEEAKEKEHLRELQRQSIAEMRREHEEQLQHVKQLKEQEIDAVTSASSHTRSLNSIIEQMEVFSGKLNNLSNKVESTHQSTSHEMEINARLRVEQQRAQQDRLMHQQRDLEEERARLQDVITQMEIRLNDQTRLLEKERWRATAEQTKVESVQRSLEEERRLMNQHFSIEREELERAKSALLEEQQSVMQHCAEERRRLAGEWAAFHTQQKLNNGRIERDTNWSLQLNAQQEGTIFSLAKEQAELKVKAVELKSKEKQLAQQQEALNQEHHELQLEKEKVNTMAIRIKQRAEEVDSMSKLSSQRYEEGEQALMEAKRVESEHQARLHAIQLKMERLQQQEQQIHQERLSLAQQRHLPHKLTVELPVNTLMPPIRNQIVSTINHSYLPPVRNNTHRAAPANSRSGQDTERVVGSEASELDARLAIFRHAAEKDRDFLEDEHFFLETLKKSSV